MLERTIGHLRSLLYFAALGALAGCAQPSGPTGPGQTVEPGKISSDAPTDYWKYDSMNKIAYVGAPGHSAEAVIGCLDDDRRVVFRVDPLWTDAIEARYRTVTITFDGDAPIDHSWFSASTGYGIFGDAPGFSDLLNQLKSHGSVELTLSDPGRELDRHSFTLNGAKEAIDAVLAQCKGA